jgi:2-polyprenyl-6-methoxyphenol hydroxylase-like FAD-dependent oxidoreductase
LKYHLFYSGGGPAGLSLAIGLKRKGFRNLIVYEREKGKRIFS